MDLTQKLDSHKYLYLTRIEEPSDNVLRLIIQEAIPTGEPENLQITKDASISNCRPIESVEGCSIYQILFSSYIAYSVRNESFTIQDDSENFSGRLFRVYSDSRFLDFVKSGTIATNDYPGPFKHYGIACLNHDLDIVSVQEPEIRELS